jgi:hypothetical protein
MVQISVPEGFLTQTPDGFYTRGGTKFKMPTLEQVEEDRRTREQQAREKAPEALSDYFDVLKSASSDYSTYTGHDARRESERLFQEDLVTTLSKSDASNLLRPLSYDLSDVDVGEFTFDKTLEDFRGPEGNWLYGDISNENLKAFQEELLPVMAKAVAKEQLDSYGKGERIGDYVGIPWTDALTGALANNPEVQQIYQKYGVSPTRTDKEGSQYLYDPFSFQEIRTLDRSSDWRDTAKGIGLALAGGALLGPLAGSLTSGLGVPAALQPTLSGALTGAGTAAITGGDPLKGALTGGIDSGLGMLKSQAPALYNDVKFGYDLARGEPGLALLNRGLNVFEDGKVTGTTTVGEKVTTDALNKVGLTNDALDKYNVNQNDLVAGLVKVEEKLIKGDNFEDSLRSGLLEYAKEGGGVPDLGINLGIALKTPEFVSDVARAIREAGSVFDDKILQPPKEAIETLYEAIPKPDVSLRGPDIDIKGPDINLKGPDVDIKAPDIEALDLGLDPSLSLQIAAGGKPTKSVTEDLFEDFLFEKKYQSPELLEAALPLDILRRTI